MCYMLVGKRKNKPMCWQWLWHCAAGLHWLLHNQTTLSSSPFLKPLGLGSRKSISDTDPEISISELKEFIEFLTICTNFTRKLKKNLLILVAILFHQIACFLLTMFYLEKFLLYWAWKKDNRNGVIYKNNTWKQRDLSMPISYPNINVNLKV